MNPHYQGIRRTIVNAAADETIYYGGPRVSFSDLGRTNYDELAANHQRRLSPFAPSHDDGPSLSRSGDGSRILAYDPAFPLDDEEDGFSSDLFPRSSALNQGPPMPSSSLPYKPKSLVNELVTRRASRSAPSMEPVLPSKFRIDLLTDDPSMVEHDGDGRRTTQVRHRAGFNPSPPTHIKDSQDTIYSRFEPNHSEQQNTGSIKTRKLQQQFAELMRQPVNRLFSTSDDKASAAEPEGFRVVGYEKGVPRALFRRKVTHVDADIGFAGKEIFFQMRKVKGDKLPRVGCFAYILAEKVQSLPFDWNAIEVEVEDEPSQVLSSSHVYTNQSVGLRSHQLGKQPPKSILKNKAPPPPIISKLKLEEELESRRRAQASRHRSPSPLLSIRSEPDKHSIEYHRSMMLPSSTTTTISRGRSRSRSPLPVVCGREGSKKQYRSISRSPVRRRSRSPKKARSRSPVRRRSPSPVRRRSPSPVRRRSPSPVRRRSPSPVRRRSPSPVRRRSPSPVRRRSPSPIRRRPPSPVNRRSRSSSSVRSVSPIRRRSRSPVDRRIHSPASARSRSPRRRRSRTPPIARSRSSGRRRSQSISPKHNHRSRNRKRSRSRTPSSSPRRWSSKSPELYSQKRQENRRRSKSPESMLKSVVEAYPQSRSRRKSPSSSSPVLIYSSYKDAKKSPEVSARKAVQSKSSANHQDRIMTKTVTNVFNIAEIKQSAKKEVTKCASLELKKQSISKPSSVAKTAPKLPFIGKKPKPKPKVQQPAFIIRNSPEKTSVEKDSAVEKQKAFTAEVLKNAQERIAQAKQSLVAALRHPTLPPAVVAASLPNPLFAPVQRPPFYPGQGPLPQQFPHYGGLITCNSAEMYQGNQSSNQFSSYRQPLQNFNKLVPQVRGPPPTMEHSRTRPTNNNSSNQPTRILRSAVDSATSTAPCTQSKLLFNPLHKTAAATSGTANFSKTELISLKESSKSLSECSETQVIASQPVEENPEVVFNCSSSSDDTPAKEYLHAEDQRTGERQKFGLGTEEKRVQTIPNLQEHNASSGFRENSIRIKSSSQLFDSEEDSDVELTPSSTSTCRNIYEVVCERKEEFDNDDSDEAAVHGGCHPSFVKEAKSWMVCTRCANDGHLLHMCDKDRMKRALPFAISQAKKRLAQQRHRLEKNGYTEALATLPKGAERDVANSDAITSTTDRTSSSQAAMIQPNQAESSKGSEKLNVKSGKTMCKDDSASIQAKKSQNDINRSSMKSSKTDSSDRRIKPDSSSGRVTRAKSVSPGRRSVTFRDCGSGSSGTRIRKHSNERRISNCHDDNRDSHSIVERPRTKLISPMIMDDPMREVAMKQLQIQSLELRELEIQQEMKLIQIQRASSRGDVTSPRYKY